MRANCEIALLALQRLGLKFDCYLVQRFFHAFTSLSSFNQSVFLTQYIYKMVPKFASNALNFAIQLFREANLSTRVQNCLKEIRCEVYYKMCRNFALKGARAFNLRHTQTE